MALPPSNTSNSCSDATAQSGNNTASAEWQRLGASAAASSSSANLPGRREDSLMFMLQNSNVSPSFSQGVSPIGSAETIMLPPIVQADQGSQRQFLARIIIQALEIIDEDPAINEDGGTRPPSRSSPQPPAPSRQ